MASSKRDLIVATSSADRSGLRLFRRHRLDQVFCNLIAGLVGLKLLSQLVEQPQHNKTTKDEEKL